MELGLSVGIISPFSLPNVKFGYVLEKFMDLDSVCCYEIIGLVDWIVSCRNRISLSYALASAFALCSVKAESFHWTSIYSWSSRAFESNSDSLTFPFSSSSRSADIVYFNPAIWWFLVETSFYVEISLSYSLCICKLSCLISSFSYFKESK